MIPRARLTKQLLLTLITFAGANGQAQAPTAVNTFQIMIFADVDPAPVQKQFPRAQVTTYRNREQLRRKTFLPLAQQSRFFEKAGLTAYVAKLDQFDRDMLVGSLRGANPDLVHKKYAAIPLDVCARSVLLLKQE